MRLDTRLLRKIFHQIKWMWTPEKGDFLPLDWIKETIN